MGLRLSTLGKFQLAFISFVFASVILSFPMRSLASDVHRVLLLNSYDQTMSWVKEITKAVTDVMNPDETGTILYIENMDTKRANSQTYYRLLGTLFKEKYKDVKFDLILTSDNNAFDFLRQSGDELFPRVPIVFCGVNDFTPDLIANHPNFTGIPERFSDVETVETMLRLHPNTKEIFIINDNTPTGQAWTSTMKKNFAVSGLDQRVDIRYAAPMPIEELKQKINALGNESLMLLGVYFKDSVGKFYSYEEIGRQISRAAQRPIYALLRFNLSDGVIGGKMTTGYSQGEAAARMGQKILNGTPPSEMQIGVTDVNKYVFDWLALKKWGIQVKDLPARSNVINHDSSILQDHPRLTFGALAVMLVLISFAVGTFWLASQRKKNAEDLKTQVAERTAALADSEARHRALFERNKATVMLIDASTGKIIDANPASEKFYGWKRDELRRLTIHEINTLPPDDVEREMKRAAQEQRDHFFFKHRLASGDIRDVEVHSGPIQIGGQNLLYSIVHDITERCKIDRELVETRKAAEDANEAKSNFLAAMSHDLRTPLNAIMGFSDMMRHKTFGEIGHPRYEEYAEDIHSSGALLIRLINDVLDLSKIEAGKFELVEEELEIPTINEQCMRQLRGMAECAKLTLVQDAQPGLPKLRGDERALMQVMNNLVSNAIKFTPRGGKVMISTSLNDQNAIEVTVSDTGIGMTDDGIVKALKPFEQADGTHSRRHEGTGLGLHLCVNFMKLFGGTLSIDSVVDEGTKVTIQFPPERTVST